ncbi:lysine-specific demethylase JMJ17-like [Silene latifolia]|uniref:lysine-specific demethylase JMJ17-like n=1 Tax=Silene latifolia TaxID=37657 RepID=UPI003D76CB65
MGKGRPRAVEKGGGIGGSLLASSSSNNDNSNRNNGSMNIPLAPVYYPSEEEFKEPLEYIYKIREQAEPYGICKIVPPKTWKPPFALDLNKFTFPTKTQAIHQLQARPASCDSKTFELEYNRFLEEHCGGKKLRRKVIFEGEELDLCKLFNAVKRFGGYDKVAKEKKWGEVFRFVRLGCKISECAKHVLGQLYLEHLCDYEEYYNKLNNGKPYGCKRRAESDMKDDQKLDSTSSKKRRKENSGEGVKVTAPQKEEVHDQICEQCESGLHGEVMLLCDRCNKGWHIYCLSPPLDAIPPGNWYCLDCLNSDKDSFGFVPGKCYTLEAFRKIADRTKKKWFGSASCTRMQLEKKFWEIVEGSLGEVEVMYGSDLDTSVYGSGFPRSNDHRPESVDAEVWDQYCNSPWNLNNLPKLKGSMLRAVHHNIAGVMVPWLYIGMLFSAFCWHFEDHCFYSMNYHHWGEPKCWYSVPGCEAPAFEKVMRSCLPDLFDAQPDLLFQLVTMLNPSVLQESGVPVYSVLQEPGNFVITFPRSYHGGFNFGLNCAEAVNFAPADWLPYGGFGSELYQRFHKPAVLSHEELLFVVAKIGCDAKVAPFVIKELVRVISKEKMWRERLWRKGLVKTFVMSPRKQPDYVGIVEDPTCIICQQYLYLSAVICRCRPLTFVCLEHWEPLCECNPRKRRLLYRHSLAELSKLLSLTESAISCCSDNPQLSNLPRQFKCSTDSGSLSKKVKGKQVTLAQLAEEWLLSSCEIFQLPFSPNAYTNALKKAQQFLWAGPEMDPVRDMVNNLTQAKDWAEGIRKCLSGIQSWSKDGCSVMEKVHFEQINSLLTRVPFPCNEPEHVKLKDYSEEAQSLIQEINIALSESTISMTDLEDLNGRVSHFPVYIRESEKFGEKIFALKAWLENARKCILEKRPASVDIKYLEDLESEMLELQVHFPEKEKLLELIAQANICQARCNEMLKGPITLEDLELLVDEFATIVVDIPELKLLCQYHSDTVSWISRLKHVLLNGHATEDQESVLEDLRCIQKDGLKLRVQVDELALVDNELKKASCREKALRVRRTKVSLEFVQQVLSEASILQIELEELFISLSEILTTAISWEKRAKHLLASDSELEDLRNALRTSEDINIILPSRPALKDAMSAAEAWLESSKSFLQSSSVTSSASTSLLAFDELKEQVSKSKLLRVAFAEKALLENVLRNCEEWRCSAYSSLKDVEKLLNRKDYLVKQCSDVTSDIDKLRSEVETVVAAGLSLGFDFSEFSILRSAASTLQWCSRVFLLSKEIPSLEEIEQLMEERKVLPAVYEGSFLYASLTESASWQKRASEVLLVSCSKRGYRRFLLSDAENILTESQDMLISFPSIVGQLKDAVEKHKSWQDKARSFFSVDSGERSWSMLLQLKELGKDAFNCPELDMVISEFETVQTWQQKGGEVFGCLPGSLTSSLLKIKQSLYRSLFIYEKSKCSKVSYFCTGCSSNSDDQEFIGCSTCKDCYHLRCLVPKSVGSGIEKDYICPYCVLVDSGSICRSKDSPLKYKGKRPELESLVQLSSDAKKFTVRLEEEDILLEIVDQALACRVCLSEVVNSSLSFFEMDISAISRKLTIALKALDVAGVCDPIARRKFDQALARNSWRIRATKLIEGPQKPVMQQVQRHLKEGVTISVPPEDHFKQKLVEMKEAGARWAEIAKKVAGDSGDQELCKVFDLISEGERLPIHFEKELKLLRDRSVLYCICRKPYDQKPMIACDQCDEWYHFDCVNLVSPPEIYICPACKPQMEGKLCLSPSLNPERSQTAKDSEPQTPSPRHAESRWRPRKGKPWKKRKAPVTADINRSPSSSDIFDRLVWKNRKAGRRIAKKRVEFKSLSPFSLTSIV